MKERVTTRFRFVGGVVIPRNKEMMQDRSGSYEMRNMSFGVKNGSNVNYIRCHDTVKQSIKTIGTDGNMIEISWDDRLDEDIINSVVSYRQYIVNLDGDRHVFITAYDFMEYLNKVLPDYKDDIVATGTFGIHYGADGTKYEDYDLTAVYTATEADHKGPAFKMNMRLYYNKESIDKSSLNDDKKISFNAYVPIYVWADRDTKMFPIDIVWDTSKFDLNNPKHKAKYDVIMSQIDIKSKNYVSMMFEIAIVNGAEEVKFDESCLTPLQKMVLEGNPEMTIDNFRPKNAILGSRVHEMRISNILPMNDYSNGYIDSGMTPAEFEDEIYTPTLNMKMEDVKKPNTVAAVEDDDTDDLF